MVPPIRVVPSPVWSRPVPPFHHVPIAQWLISTYGAQMACRILAVVFLIGVGAVAWMIVKLPEGWTPGQRAEKNYNIPQMVKTPVFWVMLVMFIFAAAGTMMVSATSPIAQKIGQSAMTAAMCVSIMTLANMFRPGFGFIYDKLKGWNSLILVLVINGISMCMLTVAKICFHPLHLLVGFSFGGLLVVFAPIVKNVFGSRFYNRNWPDLHRLWHRRVRRPQNQRQLLCSTGSYVYLGSAILAAAAVVLVFVARKLTAAMQSEKSIS